mmetsp:Transcript_4078/g.6320  ORF Transcript_4078/g.6320 Transcript_4078/m.6320 type:complete len:349 (+) Transcript_4078:74-1120(+)
MSAPYINRRVRVVGTSQPELNNQEGRATAYNTEKMRYTVLLDNGRSVALKPANLSPAGSEDEDSGHSGMGGGFPGMGGGFPGMSGMPDLSQLLNNLPPWLRTMLMRGQLPSMGDLERLLPPGINIVHIGILVVIFVLMLFKFGLLKTGLLFAVCGFVVQAGFGAYVQSGGGVAGIKAAGVAIGRQASAKIFSVTKQHISPNLSLGAVGVALVGVLYYTFLTGQASLSPSSSAYTRSYGISPADAYDRGYEDALAGRPHNYAAHMDTKAFEYSPSAAPTGGGMFSAIGGFGIGKLFSLAILGKQIYSLGSVPGGGWNMNLAMANLANQSTLQKVFLAFMVMRLLGMSPI